MTSSLFYEKPVVLDRAIHRGMKVAPSNSFLFAKRVNSLYLAGVEFAEACKEYAIVFTKVAGQKVAPMVMLGLRDQENLLVDSEGNWTATYVPAFVRRYPFVLSQLADQSMGLCIDEAYSGLNTKKGEALFDAQGNNTPFLQSALDFLNRYQIEYMRTDRFCQGLLEAGLLMEMNAKADLVDGSSHSINGLMIVDEKKLLALPDAQVLKLFRAGELHWLAMHLVSLSNMQRLVDRLANKKTKIEAAPRPVA
ncbi:MAG: SapC family protein [Burkholderiaceae bacterium]